MIEVEKKFAYTPENKARLIAGAKFLGEKKLVDIYYDLPDYSLTANSWWLRSRNGAFELKMSLNTDNESFDEIENEQKIRSVLKLPIKKDFLSDLMDAGYTIFCACTTIREKYQKDIFHIDLDQSIFEGFSYGVMEIEVMVERENQIADALIKIDNLATQQGLNQLPTQGKVVSYLKHCKPEHFDVLLKAGVVKNF